jgi:hypothetical protein
VIGGNAPAHMVRALQAKRASLAAQSWLETETAPVRYIAELSGADTGSERAIRSECVRCGNDREPSAIQTGSSKR